MSEETPPVWPYGAPPAPQQWQPPYGQPQPYGYPGPGYPGAGYPGAGYPGAYGYPRPRNTNGFCIAALICSILGIFLWVIGPVLGITFGVIGLRQTSRLGESGRGLAIAGIAVGVVMLLIGAVLVVSLFATSNGPTFTNNPTV